MAGITLTEAQEQLNRWMAASTAVAARQSYTIDGRTMTFANAREIRETIDYWEAKVATLSAKADGRRRVAVMRPNF